jgi:hypothetical protein
MPTGFGYLFTKPAAGVAIIVSSTISAKESVHHWPHSKLSAAKVHGLHMLITTY